MKNNKILKFTNKKKIFLKSVLQIDHKMVKKWGGGKKKNPLRYKKNNVLQVEGKPFKS